MLVRKRLSNVPNPRQCLLNFSGYKHINYAYSASYGPHRMSLCRGLKVRIEYNFKKQEGLAIVHLNAYNACIAWGKTTDYVSCFIYVRRSTDF